MRLKCLVGKMGMKWPQQTEWKLRMSEGGGWLLTSSDRKEDLLLICSSIEESRNKPDVARRV